MRLRNLVAFAVAALMALPVVAQEQTGSIQGIVKDAQGGAVPGVTVEARNANGALQSTTTDASGAYRFPALPPGKYSVTSKLSGFATSRVDVVVSLGQVLNGNMTMKLGAMTETVEVSGEAPLIDVKQSARTVSLRDEAITKMPKGRDFTTLVTQAPGTNLENGKLGGISIDGASASENRFIVDGAETTNLQSGTSGKTVITDFVDEVQVKSSGYTAEFGGATGGVISAVTKSGTNSFRGDVFGYYSGSSLNGANRPTLRLVPTNSNASEYVTYAKDKEKTFEPGITLGGPIMKDKMWFFLGYNPSFDPLDRTVTSRADGQARTKRQDFTRQNLTANITNQISDKLRSRVAFTSSGYKQTGRLQSQDGTSSNTANYDINDISSNYSGSAQLDYTASNKLFLHGQVGYYRQNLYNEGIYQGTRYLFCTSNVGQAGVPANFQAAVGTTNVPTNNSTARDIKERIGGQFDVSYFVSAAGQHQFKAGVQMDRIGNDVLTGETGNLVRIFWNRTLSGQTGAYGYYQVRSNGVNPQLGFITQGKIHENNLGLFLQDAWTINNKLTLNLGVRTENEHVPNFADASYGLPATAINFKFKDKLAPRAGFAYDVKGDGQWKVYGSWGIFYDIMKLELPRGSFGGDKWLEYYYTLDTPDYANLDTASCPPACPGRLIQGPIDFRHPSLDSDTLDPNLKPYKSQEAVLGIDHELNHTLSVGVRYVHKQLDRTVEDTGALDAQQNEIYVIGNPGEGPLTTAYVLANGTKVPLPKPQRTYNAVEASLNKRMSNRWSGRFSYLWSRLYGNYTGLSQGDENGRTSPNVGRGYDYPLIQFQGDGTAAYGLLPTDRTHQLKLQLVYDFKFGTSAGLNWYGASGIVRTRELAVIPPNNFPVQYLGRASDGRLPFYNQADLFVQHQIKLSGHMNVTLSANVINLLNSDTATNYFATQLASGQGVNFSEEAFYKGQVNIPALITNIPKDPRFLQNSAYQSSRAIRLGAKLSF
ncbi:MAG: TonB-dependent receptor [Vicinamibacteria bacterium]